MRADRPGSLSVGQKRPSVDAVRREASGYPMHSKQVKGFQSGDLVWAGLPTGKKAGTHLGSAAVRATGSFNFQTSVGVTQGVSHRDCRILQRGDGYGYSLIAHSTKESGHRGDASRRALSLPGIKAVVPAQTDDSKEVA